jgi:ribose transport system permease protein
MSGIKTNIEKIWSKYSVIVIFVLLVGVSTFIQGADFFSLKNLVNIMRNNAVVGIISLGMTFVIISGGIDLSVGSMLVGVGVIIILVQKSLEMVFSPVICAIFALLAGLLSGAALGLINGLIITKGKIAPFIVTLGTMNIYRSIAQHFMKGGGFTTNNTSYINISNYELFESIPLPIIYWAMIAIGMFIIAKHTRLGRYIYAVGSNEKAARLSTINVNSVKLTTYTLMGLIVALAAVVETSRMGSINATSSGHYYEMDAIAASVVGGTRMSGGKGIIIGAFFGMLIIGVINNMMTLIGIPPFLVNAMKGLIIILAVLLQKKETE